MDEERFERLLRAGVRSYFDQIDCITSTATTHEDVTRWMGLEPNDLAPYVEWSRNGSAVTLTIRFLDPLPQTVM